MAMDGFASFHYINGPVPVSPPAGTLSPSLNTPKLSSHLPETNHAEIFAHERSSSPLLLLHLPATGNEARDQNTPRTLETASAFISIQARGKCTCRWRHRSPHGSSPEDVMRALGKDWNGHWNSHHQVMEYLYDTLAFRIRLAAIVAPSLYPTMPSTSGFFSNVS
jgi:hypothetical protein